MLYASTLLAAFALASDLTGAPPDPTAPQDPLKESTVSTLPSVPPLGGSVGAKAQSVPEPAAMLLVGTGLVGLALTRRKRRPLP